MSFLDVCGDISNVVATALAALSIYFTCREQKRVREYEKNKDVVEQKLLWYNEVVLKDIIAYLNDFVDDTNRQLEHCKLKADKNTIEDELKSVYNLMKDRYKSLKEKIFFLKTFSQELYMKCDDSLQVIYDTYSDIINQAIEKKRITYIDSYVIQKSKGEIFSTLYEWANNFVKSK